MPWPVPVRRTGDVGLWPQPWAIATVGVRVVSRLVMAARSGPGLAVIQLWPGLLIGVRGMDLDLMLSAAAAMRGVAGRERRQRRKLDAYQGQKLRTLQAFAARPGADRGCSR
jgi:hypothetical protein